MWGALILLSVISCLLYFLFNTQRPDKFPPGPRPLPLFGNLLDLNLLNPLDDLQRLSDQYGRIFSLFIGSRPAVVLTGAEAIKEALVNKGVDFAGRPQGLMVNHVTKDEGVILADYGPRWKEHRRFALMTLRNFGLGKQTMEERILGEISHVIAKLNSCVGGSMSPQTMFHSASSNIICAVLFGARFEYDDETLKTFIKVYTENAKIANGPWAMIYDSFPMIRSLPLPFRKAFKNADKARDMCWKMINQHKKTRVPGQPRDLIDCYLDELDEREESTFEECVLVMYLLDLHFAGTDTTSNTLLTAFLYLSTHPEIQERCYQEITEVLGGRDNACFEDRHQMPYMQAVIHECQRLANSVPLSVFHCTTKDTELRGYHIPKGTLIIPNLTSALSEDGKWKNARGFHPSNFLNELGEFEKPEAFMPFSVGPRMCLGEGLARMELFLIMVTLLRRFKFGWPEDAGVPDYTPIYGVTLTPKPYRMTVSLRDADTQA
ncbi:cytochrome P450 2F2-like [Engraulis encrasicolus]|uniref:cytochrome P450 2F2-like n=1 Tax=Engraulis encrasicolus TaxID=184585 RepID=UPI002FD444EC